MPERFVPARRRDRLRRLIVDVEPLRRDHDFRLLWIGQAVSGLGRQVTTIVLPYQLYVLTGTPLAIDALALVQVVRGDRCRMLSVHVGHGRSGR